MACFASDVEMFLQVLSHDNKCELLKKLMKECQSIETVPTKALGKFITVFKIQNIVGELFTLPIDGIIWLFTLCFLNSFPLMSLILSINSNVFKGLLNTLAHE